MSEQEPTLKSTEQWQAELIRWQTKRSVQTMQQAFAKAQKHFIEG